MWTDHSTRHDRRGSQPCARNVRTMRHGRRCDVLTWGCDRGAWWWQHRCGDQTTKSTPTPLPSPLRCAPCCRPIRRRASERGCRRPGLVARRHRDDVARATCHHPRVRLPSSELHRRNDYARRWSTTREPTPHGAVEDQPNSVEVDREVGGLLARVLWSFGDRQGSVTGACVRARHRRCVAHRSRRCVALAQRVPATTNRGQSVRGNRDGHRVCRPQNSHLKDRLLRGETWLLGETTRS